MKPGINSNKTNKTSEMTTSKNLWIQKHLWRIVSSTLETKNLYNYGFITIFCFEY